MDDVESPNSRRQLFVAAKRSNERYQSVIKKLRKQNYDLERKILNLEQLIDHLKNENKIDQNCFSMLKVCTCKSFDIFCVYIT